jgi:ComF family protein
MLDAWRHLTTSLPGTCQVCGRWPARPVCPACAERFASPVPRCPGCAARLPPGAPAPCGACRLRRTPSPLCECVAAVDYAYPWDGLVARFKFRGEPGWALPLAELMLGAPGAVAQFDTCDLVAPVPLGPARLSSRGYNQAWELIKALRRSPRLTGRPPPGLAQALVRIGERPDQHELPREERLRNLRDAFVAHPAHAPQLAGAHVLLVDDVTTTGATLQAAAQALLRGGAQRVSALVFARTPDP